MTRAHERDDVAHRDGFTSSTGKAVSKGKARRVVSGTFPKNLARSRISKNVGVSEDFRKPWKNAASLRKIFPGLRIESERVFSRSGDIRFPHKARHALCLQTQWQLGAMNDSSRARTREAGVAAVRLQHQRLSDGG